MSMVQHVRGSPWEFTLLPFIQGSGKVSGKKEIQKQMNANIKLLPASKFKRLFYTITYMDLHNLPSLLFTIRVINS